MRVSPSSTQPQLLCVPAAPSASSLGRLPPNFGACDRSLSSSAAAVGAAAAVVESLSHEHRGPRAFTADTIEGPGWYQMGIIDPLQRWTVWKRLERALKIVLRCYCKGRCATACRRSSRTSTRGAST